MYRPIFAYVGIRFFFNTRNRFYYLISMMSVFLITFSVMSLIVMLSVSNGFEKELEDNIIRLIPQAILTNENWRVNSKYLHHINVPFTKDVYYSSLFTTGEILIQSKKNICSGIMLGINRKDPEILLQHVLNKNKLDLFSKKYQIIIGSELAKKLSVQEHDIVKLIVPEVSRLTPIGEILREKIFIISGIFFSNSEVDNYQVLVNQKDASNLMNYPDGYVTGLRFWFKHPIKIISKKKYKFYKNSLVLHNWTEKKGELLQSIRMEENMMKILLILIIVLSIFSVVSLINFTIVEKKFEISIFETYGLNKRNIMFIFLLQGLLSCTFGSSFGIIFGIFFSKNINLILPNILGSNVFFPVFIQYKQILSIFILTVFITLISIILSVRKCFLYNPCKILFYE